MSISQLKPEAVDNLRPFFVGRDEPNYAVGMMIPTYGMLHGTRLSFFASVQVSGTTPSPLSLYSVYQFSTMAPVNTPVYMTENLISFYRYNGTDNKHSLSGGLGTTRFPTVVSLLAWVRFDVDSLGVNSAIISKWRPATNLRCFLLRKDTSDKLEFIISGNGTNEFSVTSTQTVVEDTWYFVGATFQASTAINLYTSNPVTKRLEKDTFTTGLPATVFDSANPAVGFMGDDPDTMYCKGDGALFQLSGETIPEHQIKNAFQIARPLFGYT